MIFIKVLSHVLLFYAAVIDPCESRDASAHADAHSEPSAATTPSARHPTNHKRQSRTPSPAPAPVDYLTHTLSQHQPSSSYEMWRAEPLADSNSSHLMVTRQIQAIVERGKIFSSQLGDWLENVGFLPVTLNVPDILNGFASWFPSGGSGSTPRKFFKMLSKMYKDITTNSDLKDELKVISEHASEFENGFKTFWDAIDFSEEFENIIKYIAK